MSTPRYVIYGLYDPRTEEIRYVGKSSSGARKRWYQHIQEAQRGKNKTRKVRFIQSLLADGLYPGIVILETFEDASTLPAAEIAWIRDLRMQGARLINHTNGGEGVTGWRATQEQRTARSQSRKTHPDKAKHVAALMTGAAKWRAANPQAASERAAQVNARRWADPSARAHMAQKMSGRVFSLETRQRMSEAQKRRFNKAGLK